MDPELETIAGPAFQVNPDPDDPEIEPDTYPEMYLDPWFRWAKIWKNTDERFFINFFDWKFQFTYP